MKLLLKSIVVTLLLIVAACSNNEDTITQAIESKVPNKIEQILYTEQQGDGNVVFFLANENQSPYQGIGFAYVEKAEDGWIMDPGTLSFRRIPKQGLIVFYEDLLKSGNDKVSYTYGKIDNPDIAEIEVASPDTNIFRKANIVSTSLGRFYFETGYHLKVRGLAKNGEIIEEQG